ncbi:nuclease-related domain-containing protein [Nocardia alba]|uniref:Nuclease-like protein n=1 Tax=Nocardia alba TaxID=225051 RepID=A0A4R1FBB6_9NOCA|nr:nuclease-related domain-containing protein [Nocardia alba]TCJ88041.1 nuclease-like protein [Nocardia alba]
MLLLVNNQRRDLSNAELRFANWVQASPQQPGVAVLNVEVPGRGRRFRQVDALVWTPQRCIATEIKGFRRRQDGVLVVPPNGPWLMDDGSVADMYGNDTTHNPVEQARAASLATKNWITEVTGEQHIIHGMALVMLLPRQQIPRLDCAHTPPMIDIVIEDYDVWRYYLHLDHAEPARWDSGQIARVLTSLGLGPLFQHNPNILADALGEPIRWSA